MKRYNPFILCNSQVDSFWYGYTRNNDHCGLSKEGNFLDSFLKTRDERTNTQNSAYSMIFIIGKHNQDDDDRLNEYNDYVVTIEYI